MSSYFNLFNWILSAIFGVSLLAGTGTFIYVKTRNNQNKVSNESLGLGPYEVDQDKNSTLSVEHLQNNRVASVCDENSFANLTDSRYESDFESDADTCESNTCRFKVLKNKLRALHHKKMIETRRMRLKNNINNLKVKNKPLDAKDKNMYEAMLKAASDGNFKLMSMSKRLSGYVLVCREIKSETENEYTEIDCVIDTKPIDDDAKKLINYLKQISDALSNGNHGKLFDIEFKNAYQFNNQKNSKHTGNCKLKSCDANPNYGNVPLLGVFDINIPCKPSDLAINISYLRIVRAQKRTGYDSDVNERNLKNNENDERVKNHEMSNNNCDNHESMCIYVPYRSNKSTKEIADQHKAKNTGVAVAA